MTDYLARVKSLLARATNDASTEEEKRSCAVIAARLIKEHDIRLSLPGATGGGVTDPLEEWFRRSHERAQSERRQREADQEAAAKRDKAQQDCKADRRKRRPVYADKPCPHCQRTH